jgi:tetratricopeptide (TPR) repeat protein
MEDLRDTVHNLRDAEEVRERTTKVWITLLILAITILGTVAAVMASLADVQAATTQRRQQVQALSAQQDQDATAADLFAYTDNNNQAQLDFERDAAWWFNRQHAPAQTVQTMRAMWLDRSQARNGAVSVAYKGYWTMFAAAQRSEELATVDGQAVAAWRDKEDGYITSAAVLAVALFLVGLVLATEQRSSRRVFVGTAILLALFASVWVIQTYAREVPDIAPDTLAAYVHGQQTLNQGDYQTASKSFAQVVKQRPVTPEAWLGLANALNAGPFPSRPSLRRAVVAYRRVIAEGDGSLDVENGLAFDELLVGQTRAARRDIALALQTRKDVDWSYAEGTLAEINMVRGDSAAAFNDLDAAVNRLDRGHLDQGHLNQGRTAQFREAFFASLRHDEAYFARSTVPPDRWQPFYTRAESMEASLDALLQPLSGPRGTAAISRLRVTYDNIDPTGGRGLIRLHFSYTGFRKGILSLRTYDDHDGQYELLEASSATRTDRGSWHGSGLKTWYVPLMVSKGDSYQVELYWNGNLLAREPVKT